MFAKIILKAKWVKQIYNPHINHTASKLHLVSAMNCLLLTKDKIKVNQSKDSLSRF